VILTSKINKKKAINKKSNEISRETGRESLVGRLGQLPPSPIFSGL
jgi:hypothetical protein